MAVKSTVLVGVLSLFCQMTFGQLLPSFVGNSVVENTVVVNSGLNSGLGLANGLGLGTGLSLGTGLGLANGLETGLGLVGAIDGGLGLLGNNILGVEFGGPGYINLASISGGGVLPVTSYGPISPSGLTVLSNNEIEGVLTVNGEVPFLSAVAFEGSVASGGTGAASCGCGDGNIGIVSENYGSSLNGLGRGLGNRVRL